MEYNLSDKKTIDRILKEENFTFKKSLGQNFLTDPSVCPKMAEASVSKNSGVIEIGPGIGVLTAELAKRARKVVAVELDERLRPVLKKTLSDFNNVTVIFGDVMKLDLLKVIEEEFSNCDFVSVCANLPYYITSPIVMSLLEKKLPITSVTVMVQKEAGERLCAEIPSRKCGAVTLAAAYYANSEILFNVGRGSFTPSPNVDSCVIKLDIRKKPAVATKDEQFFFKLIKAAYMHRRKTLVNSVSSCGIADKDSVIKALEEVGIKSTVRAEELSLEDFAKLGDFIKKQRDST